MDDRPPIRLYKQKVFVCAMSSGATDAETVENLNDAFRMAKQISDQYACTAIAVRPLQIQLAASMDDDYRNKAETIDSLLLLADSGVICGQDITEEMRRDIEILRSRNIPIYIGELRDGVAVLNPADWAALNLNGKEDKI